MNKASVLWNNFKWPHICVTAVLEREQGRKKFEEIMSSNFPTLMKTIDRRSKKFNDPQMN